MQLNIELKALKKTQTSSNLFHCLAYITYLREKHKLHYNESAFHFVLRNFPGIFTHTDLNGHHAMLTDALHFFIIPPNGQYTICRFS